MNPATRILYRGTVEYVEVEVAADVELAAQPVFFSHDGTEWTAAEWVGAAGETRAARLLYGTVENPLPTRRTPLYVRVTDDPEAPVMYAGSLIVL